MIGRTTMVKMGELHVSSSAEDVFVAFGLGSCIGLALLDQRVGAAGLAHIVLPATLDSQGGQPGKFADTAVPALIDALVRLGARRTGLEAVIAGGARMFDFGSQPSATFDVGARNVEAAKTALAAAGIPIRASAVLGKTGRTMRLIMAQGAVTVKETGGQEENLFVARPDRLRRAS